MNKIIFFFLFFVVQLQAQINTNIPELLDSIPKLQELGSKVVTSAYDEKNYTGVTNTQLPALNKAADDLKAVIPATLVPDFKVFDYGAYNFVSSMKDPEKRNDEIFAAMESLIKTKYNCQYYLLIGKHINPANGETKFRIGLKLPIGSNVTDENGGRSGTGLLSQDELDKSIKDILATANTYQAAVNSILNKNSEEAAIKRCRTEIRLLGCLVLEDLPKGLGITSQGKVIKEQPVDGNSVSYYPLMSGTVLYTIAGYAKYITVLTSAPSPTAAVNSETSRKELFFNNPEELSELQKAGLKLDDIDCVTNIFAAFNECSCKYASINWVKGSSVTALLALAPPPQSNEWKTEKIHNRPAKCPFDVSETSYAYCNNAAGIEAAKIELNPYVKNGNIYEKVLKDTEIDNLVTLIKKICPDALRDLPYETIERLFLQIAMLPEIDDDKEVALLKLMSAISRNEPTKCIENYKRFYALLEATYYNGSGSLLLHLYRQLDDRCLGFLAWQSNSKTSFIEGLIRMYNEQPTALGDRLNYFNDYIKTENYVDKVIVLGLTDTKMYQAFGSNTTYFNSYKILGEHNSLYNIRLYQVPVTTITTANPATVSTYTSTIVDESSKNYKYGYEYLSPLTPVMVDTKSAYASNALIQEAIQGQSQSIKPFLVPLLFFDYTKGAESLKQREDIIFEVLDIVTIASGIKMMTTARRYWALFETIGAVADIQVRVLDLPQNSSARKCVDIYNGIFGLIGIKNLATAAGGKTIKTVNQLVQAIKTVPNLEKDIVAGANISNSLRSKLISFRFAYAKAEADGLEGLTLAQKEDLLRMEASTNELLGAYSSIFFGNLKSYKKLLAAVDGLSDELKVKFVEDFIDAGDDVLKALDDDVNFVNTWINSFKNATGIKVKKVIDNILLAKVKSWQGSGSYPGIDAWEIFEIPAGTKLYGGLPGQSEFYSVEKSLLDVNFNKANYWNSLQVSAHPQIGYRPKVGEYIVNSTIKVAISKTLANPQHGSGGAWQVFVDDFANKLTFKKEILLQ